MDASQATDVNSTIISVEFGGTSISYNSKNVLSPEQIHARILQIDDVLNRVKPKTAFGTMVNAIFLSILAAGMVFFGSLIVVFAGFILGIGNEIGEFIITFLQALLVLAPMMGVGIALRRHVVENKKINEKRMLLEEIRRSYNASLNKTE